MGGKTGTSDDENDAWFIGFTNDVTIGVWVGYDNAEGKRRTLGGGQTGGRVAVPIFEQIVEAVWANYARKTPLGPPSPEAKKELVAMQIDLNSGNRVSDRIADPDERTGFVEYFRKGPTGGVVDTQNALVSHNDVAASQQQTAQRDSTRRFSEVLGIPPRQSPPSNLRSYAPRPEEPPPKTTGAANDMRRLLESLPPEDGPTGVVPQSKPPNFWSNFSIFRWLGIP